MRTTFVNPRRRKRSKSTRKRRRPATRSRRKTTRRRRRRNTTRRKSNMQMANPRRRRRRTRRRRRRRNAGITPFVAGNNPYILSNPRRRRRRNPGMPRLTLRNMTDKLMKYGGGSAIGTAANVFVLNDIESDWLRNGARVGSAVLGGMFLRGELGAATAGALMYPVWVEVAAMLNLPVGTDASLDVLSADLEDAMDTSEVYDW